MCLFRYKFKNHKDTKRVGAMDIREYCDSMYQELTWMKAKVYDILQVIDQLPREERARIRPQTGELNLLVGDLSRRIDRLMGECPVDWCRSKREVETEEKVLR
jgi:hypothetical protein